MNGLQNLERRHVSTITAGFSDLEKAKVKAHERKSKSGKLSHVKQHIRQQHEHRCTDCGELFTCKHGTTSDFRCVGGDVKDANYCKKCLRKK